ncbi:MAG: hypothetical protein E7301_07350 [Butyrivibrio sp.]|nr:hypothetical protein [Butyrivibrio sp.]
MKRMYRNICIAAAVLVLAGHDVSAASISAEDLNVQNASSESAGSDELINEIESDTEIDSVETENSSENIEVTEQPAETDGQESENGEDIDETDHEKSGEEEDSTENSVSNDINIEDHEENFDNSTDDNAENNADSNDNSMVDTEEEHGDDQLQESPLVSEAYRYEREAYGYTFLFSADRNVLPEGVEPQIIRIDENDSLIKEVEKELNRDVFSSVLFDIKFIDDEGNEIQPENGDVHVSIRLSEEAMYEQDELEGTVELKVFHFHEADIEDVGVTVEKEDSDTEIPVETVEEVYVSEDNIDPETMVLIDDSIVEHQILNSPMEKEYYQDVTLDFDTDSFSTFLIANVKLYSYNKTTTGNLTTIDLSSNISELNSDFRATVQGALDEAWGVTENDTSKYYKIIIPAGTYYKGGNKALRIGSNTTLQMDGVTVINNTNHIMLTTEAIDGEGGFSDYQNIVLSGGCWDANGYSSEHSMVKLAHMTGLTIQNVTFEDSSSPHMLEIAACKNVNVSGCVFQNARHSSSELEAFQIDVQKDGFMTYTVDPADDDYPCVNVEVSGCTFTDLERGFGSHGAIVGDFYYKNINVHDCTFNDIKNTAIMCTMWKDSSISNNIITNVGRGIDTSTYYWYTSYPTDSSQKNNNSLSYSVNTEISGNQITIGGSDRNSGTWSGILLSGYYCESGSSTYPEGLYTTSGYNVHDNSITGYNDWNSYSADDIFSGIYTLYTNSVALTQNTISNGDFGIRIQGGGEVASMSSNSFSGEKYANIAVKSGGIVSSMSGNKLTMDCPYGIYADDSTSCNGTCEVPTYKLGIGESISTRTGRFSLFTTDLSDKVKANYKSSKKSIAKTTKAGKIKGVKKGKSTITASWTRGDGTVNIKLTANVKKAPTSITLKKSKTISKGKTYQISPKLNKGAYCSKYTYKSSNKKVAKVSSTGLVTAKKKGTTYITVTTYNGLSARIKIKVK